jgi:hypothetical protein
MEIILNFLLVPANQLGLPQFLIPPATQIIAQLNTTGLNPVQILHL